MNDQELLRYSRHILLEEIDIDGQELFRRSRVLIVGAGGLGSAAALYLAAAGVGTLTIVDDDVVDLTNLQRQIAHTTDRIGWPKVKSVAAAIAALNPEVVVKILARRLDISSIEFELKAADVAVDCSDNFATRHAINRACVLNGTPLVSGSALRFDGQLATYDPRIPNAPCYACIFPAATNEESVSCATMGVFGPLVGMVGTAQAADTLHVIRGFSRALAGRLRMVNARNMEWTEIKTARDPHCAVCSDINKLL